MSIYKKEALLERYLLAHSAEEDPILQELTRHTYLKETHPRMLSGHILGSFLTQLSMMLSPARILEIGTYTGYSAICLARGLKKGGRLITIEANDELRSTAETFFEKAGVQDRIELLNGDALEIMKRLEGNFDLVFIDANKEDYLEYYNLVIDRVKPGGYLLADNVLWGGKVISDPGSDQATRAIHEFNAAITADHRVKNLLLPIRDGIMCIKKL